jgi:hypothetical protein
MIYDYPAPDEALRQGDIFVGLPRVEISLKRVPVLTDEGDKIETAWDDLVNEGKPVTAVLAVRPVMGIIVSQDCDASHIPDITLCEILGFREVEHKTKDTTSPKSWMRIITQHCRLNQKWFYLPPDPKVGFQDRMGVQFYVTIRVPRQELEQMRHLRKGRLKEVARAHFRERIAEFFRRYPYDEWYPLNHDELAEYKNDHPDAEPFPWQTIPQITEE